jgi:hypothetical protein
VIFVGFENLDVTGFQVISPVPRAKSGAENGAGKARRRVGHENDAPNIDKANCTRCRADRYIDAMRLSWRNPIWRGNLPSRIFRYFRPRRNFVSGSHQRQRKKNYRRPEGSLPSIV